MSFQHKQQCQETILKENTYLEFYTQRKFQSRERTQRYLGQIKTEANATSKLVLQDILKDIRRVEEKLSWKVKKTGKMQQGKQ